MDKMSQICIIPTRTCIDLWEVVVFNVAVVEIMVVMVELWIFRTKEFCWRREEKRPSQLIDHQSGHLGSSVLAFAQSQVGALQPANLLANWPHFEYFI